MNRQTKMSCPVVSRYLLKYRARYGVRGTQMILASKETH